jgi:hypothetical protein
MPTIEKRTKNDGKEVYRVKVRRRGYSTQTATFSRLTDARKWAQMTEAAIEEGRHFKTKEAKRHTVAELVDRYICEVLPGKEEGLQALTTLCLVEASPKNAPSYHCIPTPRDTIGDYCTAPTSSSPGPFPCLVCGCPRRQNFSLNVCFREYSSLTDF